MKPCRAFGQGVRSRTRVCASSVVANSARTSQWQVLPHQECPEVSVRRRCASIPHRQVGRRILLSRSALVPQSSKKMTRALSAATRC